MSRNLRTGKFPLNAEPSAETLWNTDTTPLEAFYVRSHGECPIIDNIHCYSLDICFHGHLINQISVFDLIQNFLATELLVTMVCDGNRRNELNTIKRTKGFDWGSRALSTGLFRGIPLNDFLLKFYTRAQIVQSRFVLFESADRLFKGNYGTSLPLLFALSQESDVLLAFGLNGNWLPRENGFPLRTVLPGCVGGRSIKWLKKIDLSPFDSLNAYHLEDNSLFPPDIDNSGRMSQAINDYGRQYAARQSLTKPDRGLNDTRHQFVSYELNLNSVLLFPQHGETIYVAKEQQESSVIVFNGYAYDGGGRKVNRVEVTLDEGISWHQCKVWYPNNYEPPHGNKYYVMCKWSITLTFQQITSTKQIQVRAWNQSCNTQPERPNWNILGLMNNSWYTVVFDRFQADTIRFIHPVSIKPNAVKGWMETDSTRPPNQAKYKTTRPSRTFTRTEVSKHNSASDCWVVIDDNVYDLTDFLSLHPGGSASIIAHAGEDATVPFYDIHSEDAYILKSEYFIGKLLPDNYTDDTKKAKDLPRLTANCKEIGISPHRWTNVVLVQKEVLTHDTRRFTFSLPSPQNQRLMLPWGKHINIGVEFADRMLVRPYTPVKPVLPAEDDGTFELVIKIYFPLNDRPGGELSQYLDRLPIGHHVKAKGPSGVLWYVGNGRFEFGGQVFYCSRMNFIAGGTGITPILAVLRAIILAERDQMVLNEFEMKLVYANKTVNDILCQSELNQLVFASLRFSVCHVILDGRDLPGWKSERVIFESSLINTDILQRNLLAANTNACCFICGPSLLISRAIHPALAKLKFSAERIFEF